MLCENKTGGIFPGRKTTCGIFPGGKINWQDFTWWEFELRGKISGRKMIWRESELAEKLSMAAFQ